MASQFNFKTGDQFPLLVFVAWFAFKSETSISFSLGRWGDVLELDDVTLRDLGADMVFTGIGWVDVHYPCEGHIKVQLRASLPKEYLSFERLSEFINQLFVALGIPADETHESHFSTDSGEGLGIEQATDRTGERDRFYSSG